MVSRVFEICNAYESGYGHGYEKDRKRGDYYHDPELCEAYKLGYDNGYRSRTEDDFPLKLKTAEPALRGMDSIDSGFTHN